MAAPGIPKPATEDSGWVDGRELVTARNQATSAIRLYAVPDCGTRRVSLVTDSINRWSLYGGVGTAMILAALLAEARQARLRIVTRTERANPDGLEGVLSLYGIDLSREVELAHAPCYDTGYEIDACADELYITTSWWTTASALQSVQPESIVYLLQEDERMFYAYGYEHLRCSEMLRNRDIRFLVNTKLLFDHLVHEGFANIASRGMHFEPAFPHSVFHQRPPAPGGKRLLLFYARPHNVRNLFPFGLEVLESAISRGVIDLAAWDILFVGKDIPKIRLGKGRYRPKRLEGLSWADYADLAGRVDLGLCLMYTPHPSYPPFDLAASGAVVVTNRFGLKQDLSGYSPNIICGDPDVTSMLAALADGVRLAGNPEARAANHRRNTLVTDWRVSFGDIVRSIAHLPGSNGARRR